MEFGGKKRRSEIVVMGVAMSALVLSGCSDGGQRRCVDPKTGQVVESYYCADETRSAYGGVHYWYYGGSGYRVGDRVTGGSNTPPAHGSGSTHLASSSGVARGGFGSSAAAHGAGS